MKAVLDVLVVIVSFFLTECRALLAFYFSFKAFVALVPDWFFQHVSLSIDDEEELRHMTSNQTAVQLGDFLKCLTEDFKKMTLDLSPVFEGECISSKDDSGQIDGLAIGDDVPHHLLFSYTNYIGLAIVLTFTVILLVELALFRPHHFGSGRYIAFTIHMRKLLVYKIAAYVLAFFNVMVFMAFAFIAYRCYAARGMTVASQFLTNFAGTLGGVIYSGCAFALPDKEPHDLFLGAEFQAMVFKRKASEVTKDNLLFLQALDHSALVAAALSDRTALDEYCGTGISSDGYTTAEEALSLLAKVRSHPISGYQAVPDHDRALVAPAPA